MLTRKTPKPKLDGWKEANKTQLGLLGLDCGLDFNVLRRRWAVRGVPYAWSPEQLQELMEKHDFRTVGDMLAPSHKTGIWAFKAAWAASNNADCKIIDLDHCMATAAKETTH